MIPYDPEAYDLLQQGTIALAEVEANGMRVDVPYLEKTIRRTERRIARMSEELGATDEAKTWRRKYGDKMNLDSADQLRWLLFDELKLPPLKKTAGDEKWATDKETMLELDHPFARSLLEIRKHKTAVNTFLRGIAAEVVEDKIYCFFNLNLARSFRSSSDRPNTQNFPIRDPEIGPLIRSAFIASPDRQIVEIDFKGAEVIVSACQHHDPTMVKYILDPKTDMHRDMAMELFKLPEAEVSKGIRYEAKSNFVFAEFYGSWFPQCAERLWKAIQNPNSKLVGGGLLLDHMKTQGIRKLGEMPERGDKGGPPKGTFMAHVQTVEKRFWGERFKVYNQWKNEWYEAYKKQGWFKTMTGFICQGYMTKNQTTNYPIQGASFHCLLWCLIRLVQRELKRRGMKSSVTGQIHDSIIADVVTAELDEYIQICRDIILRQLPRHFPWLVIPMQVDIEVCPVGGSWADKKPYKE